MNWLRKFKIALLHAKFHRNMKKAIEAREEQNILEFKKYIYKAEDAWKQIVILTEQTK
jgi:hypothetical protein